MFVHAHARETMIERSCDDANDLVHTLLMEHKDHELCDRAVNGIHAGLVAARMGVAGVLAYRYCLCRRWDDPVQTQHRSACCHNSQD